MPVLYSALAGKTTDLTLICATSCINEVITATLNLAKNFQFTKRRISMQRWICTICQYVYDPALGDPDKGIPAGSPFESLPDDWCCPLCGAGKDVFEME